MDIAVAIPKVLPRNAFAFDAAHVPLRDVSAAKAGCSTCELRRLCIPAGLDTTFVQTLDRLFTRRIRLRKGESLFRAGDRFTSLYAVRSGSCKTLMLTSDGHDQVCGYYIRGEIIGIDGVGGGRHDCQAIMLEDTEVCVLPFDRIEELARHNGEFQRALHRRLAMEIARERNVMLMLGAMRAEQRLAAFLLDLAHRYHERGYSSTEFVLRMTREEIGSYLGLKLETVSRLFSRFHQDGLVQVQGRIVKQLDRGGLEGRITAPLQYAPGPAA